MFLTKSPTRATCFLIWSPATWNFFKKRNLVLNGTLEIPTPRESLRFHERKAKALILYTPPSSSRQHMKPFFNDTVPTFQGERYVVLPLKCGPAWGRACDVSLCPKCGRAFICEIVLVHLDAWRLSLTFLEITVSTVTSLCFGLLVISLHLILSIKEQCLDLK